MAKEFKQTIALPDTFIYEGKVYEPGEHILTNEMQYNDMVDAVKRYTDQKQKELDAEKERMHLLNVSSTSVPMDSGVDMATIQGLIDQTVEAKTAELRLQNEELQKKLDEVDTTLKEALDNGDEAKAGDPTPTKS